MNPATIKLLNRLRKIHARWDPAAHADPPLRIDVRGQAASDRIRELLASDRPGMVGRLGGTETEAIIRHLSVSDPKPFRTKAAEYIRGRRHRFWWDQGIVSRLGTLSGFFPGTVDGLIRFSQDMLVDMREIDILGSWQGQEIFLSDYLTGALRVPHSELQPYRHANPWSEALAGKKVLVIHPFEESIRRQYARRELLFQDPRVLPAFELITLKSVQSLAGNDVPFRDWFAALDSMVARAKAIDFDIAIIGAGAYGMPLAAAIKRLGKKAVHLGGVTQMLFGIRGKRWDERPEYQPFFNEHWVRPLPEEAPAQFQSVEQGCYW
jgi:hypothetical protein